MAELLRNHLLDCPAYNTKGRDLKDEPCTCGARVPSARDAAVALAVLDEIDRVPLTGIIPYPLRDKLNELRAKYTAKAIAK